MRKKYMRTVSQFFPEHKIVYEISVKNLHGLGDKIQVQNPGFFLGVTLMTAIFQG